MVREQICTQSQSIKTRQFNNNRTALINNLVSTSYTGQAYSVPSTRVTTKPLQDHILLS